MAIMTELKKFFAGRKTPVVVDVSGGSGEPLAEDGRELSEMEEDRTAEFNGASNSPAVEMRTPRIRSAADLQRSFEEMSSLTTRIESHLDAQAGRTVKLVETTDRLLKAMDTLPEINRQNARLLEVLGEVLDHSKTRDSAMHATFRRTTEAAGHQAEVLGMIQQQLDLNKQSSAQVAEAISRFQQSIGELAGASSRSANIMSDLARSHENRESELTTVMNRWQRWMLAALIGCGVVALAAVAIALLALLRR